LIKKQIICKPDLNMKGKTLHREAVRGIIRDDNMLLMVYSEVNGDYKFPGGGIQEGETPIQALRREVQEECGVEVTYISDPYAQVTEFDTPLKEDFDLFKMLSTYYPCRVSEPLHELQLDDYEAELKFKPVWVTLAEAVLNNQILLHQRKLSAPRWLQRDLFILEKLLKESYQ
jgi:8-oxo-dGTP pyrophosphatase MutT (NUDIX family)